MITLRVPTRLLQQGQGLQLLRADNPRTVGCGGCEHLAEDFARYLAAQRLKQFHFPGIRQFARRQRSVGKNTLLADVQVAHHLAVASLEVP
ncbi:hypothetical protein D3C73_1336140 [compost metagenome]